MVRAVPRKWKKLSLLSWLAYVAIGKVMIYLGMQFPLPELLQKFHTIKKWHECDLCMGAWVYGILAAVMGMSLMTALGFSYVPVVSEVVTGGVISFIVHLLSIGWRAKFEVVVV